MKKSIVLLFVLFTTLTINAQAFKAPNKVDTTTTYTYQIDQSVYKVYKSKSGAFYIWKMSKKTGKLYKYYLPKEIQIQMGRIYK